MSVDIHTIRPVAYSEDADSEAASDGAKIWIWLFPPFVALLFFLHHPVNLGLVAAAMLTAAMAYFAHSAAADGGQAMGFRMLVIRIIAPLQFALLLVAAGQLASLLAQYALSGYPGEFLAISLFAVLVICLFAADLLVSSLVLLLANGSGRFAGPSVAFLIAGRYGWLLGRTY